VKFKRKQLEDKMGLDMYAYVGQPGQRDKFYDQEGLEFDSKTGDWIVPAGGFQKPQELAYWRKHPNLHGWMHKLWEAKGNSGDFNGDELELTWEDLDMLEKDIMSGTLSTLNTRGFFFGDPSDEYYKEHDLKFCIDAKAECFLGRKVFYNSSW
jgi:hypothetical protein